MAYVTRITWYTVSMSVLNHKGGLDWPTAASRPLVLQNWQEPCILGHACTVSSRLSVTACSQVLIFDHWSSWWTGCYQPLSAYLDFCTDPYQSEQTIAIARWTLDKPDYITKNPGIPDMFKTNLHDGWREIDNTDRKTGHGRAKMAWCSVSS